MCISSLTTVYEIKELIKNTYPIHIVYNVLTSITMYHRIQGSKGIWDAINVVKRVLEENSDRVKTKVYSFDEGYRMGIVATPKGWDLVYGEVVVKENGRDIAKYNTELHKTLVIAHSPSGSGEAEVAPVTLDNLEEASGKVALTDSPAYLAYKIGLEKGIEALAWYSTSRNPHGVPYVGLFLEPNEVNGGIPGFTLPGALVQKILNKIRGGSKITIEWNIETKYNNNKLPVLEACLGEGEYTVVSTAHICHPQPGGHDNASGSALQLGIVATLAKVLDKINPRTRICFYWIPEYLGTEALFASKILSGETIVANINIDMIGSKQDITGSSIHFIRSMLINAGALTPIVKLSIESTYRLGKTFHGQPSMGSIKYDEVVYGNGSDHDVFNINSIEGVMLNEWPSKYYHTDLDTPDTIGYRELLLAGIASTMTISLISNPKLLNGLSDYIKNYYGWLMTWYAMESITRGLDRGFVEKNLRRYVGNALSKGVEWSEKLRLIQGGICCESNKPLYKGVTHISLRKIALELGIDYYKELSKNKHLSLLVSTVLPATLKKGLDVNEVIKYFSSEQLINVEKEITCFKLKGEKCMEKILNDTINWLLEKDLIYV